MEQLKESSVFHFPHHLICFLYKLLLLLMSILKLSLKKKLGVFFLQIADQYCPSVCVYKRKRKPPFEGRSGQPWRKTSHTRKSHTVQHITSRAKNLRTQVWEAQSQLGKRFEVRKTSSGQGAFVKRWDGGFKQHLLRDHLWRGRGLAPGQLLTT